MEAVSGMNIGGEMSRYETAVTIFTL